MTTRILAQQVNLPQLRKDFEISANDTVRINSAKQLFGRYIYAKVDSAIFYARAIINIGEEMDADDHILTGNNYLGIAYSVKGDFDSAANYMQRVLEIHQEAGDSINVAYSFNNLGMNYLYAGDYLRAAQSLIEAVRYKEALIVSGSTSQEVDLASTLMNIGIAYQSQQDTLQAKTYYLNAIEEADKAGNKTITARSKTSLGNLFSSEEKFDEALVLFLEAEPVFIAENDVFALGKLYNNTALVYAGLNQGDQVISYATKAIEKNKLVGNRQSEGLSYMYLGLGYIKINQLRNAIRTSNTALTLGEELEDNSILHGALKNLYEAHSALGDYKTAYEYSIRFNEVDSEIYAIERGEQIERLSSKYEADKREIEIDKLNQEAQLSSLELEKANADRNLLILLLISVILILALIVYFYQKISAHRQLLREKNGELEKLNKTKDRFFAIISHDLRGHISSFKGTGRLLSRLLEKNEKEKLEGVTTEIDKNANNLSHLLDNLLQWSMGQLKGFQPKPEAIEVHKVVDELLDIFKPIAEEKGISLVSEINHSDKVMADKESFLVTIRNLIGNALKFTDEGVVTIFSRKENDMLVIGVRDTGVGIPEEILGRLFVIEEEKIRRGTKNEKGTGLGLNLAYEFTKINRGRLEVESQEGVGTTFLVYLVHA